MRDENKYDGARDPFKMFLKEEQFINAKKKITERFYKRVSHNRSSANDPPCSLNRDHGPIRC
jgi:hypothetical protein